VPTVIDSLIVKLGLDPADFTKGQKEAAGAVVKQKGESEKWRKSVETDARKVTDAFAKFKKELIALTLAYFGLSKIKHFSGEMMQMGTSLTFLAKNVGLTRQQLSLWQETAKYMGASNADVDSMFRTVAHMGAEWRRMGDFPGFNELVMAGVDITAFTKALAENKPEEAVMRLSEAMQQLAARSPEEAQMFLQMAQLTEGAGNMIMQGTEAIQRALARQRGLFFVSDKDAAKMREMDLYWKQFVDRLREAGVQLLINIEPTILRLANEFEEWLLKGGGVEWLSQKIAELGRWLDSIKWGEFRKDMEAFAMVLADIADALGGIAAVIEMGIGGKIGGKVGGVVGKMLGHPKLGGFLGMLLGAALPEIPYDELKKKMEETPTGASIKARHDAEERAHISKANPPVHPTRASIAPPPGGTAGAGVGSVNINNVIVNTQATDAAGMAKGARSALTRELSTVTQASGGGQ
jgi:hypothetical protein